VVIRRVPAERSTNPALTPSRAWQHGQLTTRGLLLLSLSDVPQRSQFNVLTSLASMSRRASHLGQEAGDIGLPERPVPRVASRT
jgi:hypothetical protein